VANRLQPLSFALAWEQRAGWLRPLQRLEVGFASPQSTRIPRSKQHNTLAARRILAASHPVVFQYRSGLMPPARVYPPALTPRRVASDLPWMSSFVSEVRREFYHGSQLFTQFRLRPTSPGQ
jgi:hypothetical protein